MSEVLLTILYEIPYSPSNIYPNALKLIGNKGNNWTNIISNQKSNIGPLSKQSMIFDGKDKIYIFGGVSYNIVNSTSLTYEYVYKDNLYQFDIFTETWTEINYKGINSILRNVKYS